MAIIDMRNADESTFGSGVGFSSELFAGPTAYVWNSILLNGDDSVVYLYGAGIASSGGQPSAGTISDIRIDLSGDGLLGVTDVDITITGISLPLVDLAQEDNLFWEAVLQDNDTIYVFNGDSVVFNHSIMFGDGLVYAGSAGAIMSNDTLDATGTPGGVSMYGDYSRVVDASITAGNDVLMCANATAGVSVIGDIADLRAVAADVLVFAGDDTIDIACTDLDGGVEYIVGDVMAVIAAADPTYGIVLEGGDDTITNQSTGASIYKIAGDVFAPQGAGAAVTINGGSDEISGSSADEDIAGDVYEIISGFVAGGDDFIQAGGGNDDIAGDVLIHTDSTFTGGDDIIDGGLGNDTIDGQSGNDWAQFLSNGLGVAVILDEGSTDGSSTGQGSDVLRDIENVVGSVVDDTITGNREGNIVKGAGGDDSVNGLGGADLLHGGADQDTLAGGIGDDTLDGGTDPDWVDYAAAANAVTVDLSVVGAQDTGEGLDTLISIERVAGSAFDDTLTGTNRVNFLRGVGGFDRMTGGGGNDRFDFDATGDSGNTSSAADRITDFAQGADLIDVRTIDAMAGSVGTNEAFTFIGSDTFSAEGQVRAVINAAGTTTVVQLNTAGTAGADMVILLTGAFTLTDLDFLL